MARRPRMPRVAVVIPAQYGYSVEMLRGVITGAATVGPWRFLHTASLPACKEEDLSGWRGDGIIAQCANARLATKLHRLGLPVVNVSNRLADVGFPRVGPDDQAIGALGAWHFLQRGFVNLAFVGSPGWWWFSDRRQAGFEQAVREAGRESHCFAPRHKEEAAATTLTDALVHWLERLPRPLGVMACNDIRAMHIMQACQRLGLRIPDDVAVLGSDNDEWETAAAGVPLSSVDPGARRIGYEAAVLLGRLMEGQHPPPNELTVFLPPAGVVTRQSSQTIAAADPVVRRAAEYIQQNTDRPLSIKKLLGTLDVSRRSLEMRFRTHLSCTIQDAIWQAHVERARAFLTQTDLSMKQVALRSGFTGAERFSVVFRRVTGHTPTEYRRLLPAR